MTYEITANAMFMGSYEGHNEADAILAYVKDAGYDSIEAAADVCGQSIGDFLADISAVPALT